jgi:hypothetical protein
VRLNDQVDIVFQEQGLKSKDRGDGNDAAMSRVCQGSSLRVKTTASMSQNITTPHLQIPLPAVKKLRAGLVVNVAAVPFKQMSAASQLGLLDALRCLQQNSFSSDSKVRMCCLPPASYMGR